jgi:antitoxin component HigA of HigAB toxin-antitoxin module
MRRERPLDRKADTTNMAAIKNEEQLQQAIEQIQTLCRAIESLWMDILPKNPKNFAIMAEGPVDEIRKLQSDIDAYIQHLEATGSTASS